MEDVLVIRDESSLLFFNCFTLTVDHFIKLNANYIFEGQHQMLAERDMMDLVVYTNEGQN